MKKILNLILTKGIDTRIHTNLTVTFQLMKIITVLERLYGNNPVTFGGNVHYYILSGEQFGRIYGKLKQCP